MLRLIIKRKFALRMTHRPVAGAAVSAGGSSGLAASIGRQLATQGFLRLRLPQTERGQVYRAAGEVFALNPAEKLALSSRLWQPAPARQCSCVGKCSRSHCVLLLASEKWLRRLLQAGLRPRVLGAAQATTRRPALGGSRRDGPSLGRLAARQRE